ncbi:lipopolysaccharide biosynthesis protein [Iodobacter arcticus]|uniref:Lipopolysaccharide biosynthesis protein n=1 Tax=Iodobacter arcticus TaxID=590593 RepID=A0ABW2R1Z2_9NEIS
MFKKVFGGFFISNALQAGLQFLMIPFIVRALGVEEYGKWGLFEPAIYLFALIAQFGGNWSILKLVNADKMPVNFALRLCLKMCFWPALVSIALACIWAMLQFKLQYATLLMPIIILAEATLALGLASARAKLLARPYFLGILGKFGVLSLFSFINVMEHPFIVDTAVEWLAVYAIAVSFSAILVNYKILKKENSTVYSVDNEQELKAAALKYGVPIMISAIFATILNNADRYIVSSTLDHKILGSYVVALKLAGVLNFLITPVALWWPTARFQHIEDVDRGQIFFSKMSVFFSLGYSLAGAILYFLAPWLLPILAPNVHVEFSILLPLIIGVVIRAVEPSLNIGLLQEGQTHLLIYTTAIGAIFQIVLGFILSSYFMAQGVAWAFLISSIFSVGATHFISQKVYKIKFPYFLIISCVTFPFALVGVI